MYKKKIGIVGDETMEGVNTALLISMGLQVHNKDTKKT